MLFKKSFICDPKIHTITDEIKFIESIALKIKHILTNKISNNDIEFQVEESSNVFILNLYINVIKIMKYLKVKNVKFENVSLLNGKILEHRMINLFSKCLVDIDIYHNKLFINHFWELNKYMITEFTYLLKMFKNNINFFIKDIDKIKFKNTNLVLDHHSEFNKMSQNQSSFKKRKILLNNSINIINSQSMYYCSAICKNNLHLQNEKSKLKKDSKKPRVKKSESIIQVDKTYDKIQDLLKS